ncbi:hypothetical protein AGLY_003526 [Aphis glycines]|uniref:Uncharacterized protein n=1 Tax=Aphis glycines TaxID=307491 RepID=A0A6G0U198_APHGL|nr:hypothetical protein AGLY_003526 [Aphis glycines]
MEGIIEVYNNNTLLKKCVYIYYNYFIYKNFYRTYYIIVKSYGIDVIIFESRLTYWNYINLIILIVLKDVYNLNIEPLVSFLRHLDKRLYRLHHSRILYYSVKLPCRTPPLIASSIFYQHYVQFSSCFLLASSPFYTEEYTTTELSFYSQIFNIKYVSERCLNDTTISNNIMSNDGNKYSNI